MGGRDGCKIRSEWRVGNELHAAANLGALALRVISDLPGLESVSFGNVGLPVESEQGGG
jgi:hypothetical protein